MAYFKIITFSGIAPQVSPRLLAEDMAQTAQDVNVESGRLVPVTDNSTSTINSSQAPTASTRTSIYKYDYDSSIKWLEWDEDVDVVPGPVAGNTEDRLYWTGEDFPRMSVDASITSGSAPWPTTSYRLGIPAPTSSQTPSSTMISSTVPGSIFTFDATSGSIVNLTDNTIALSNEQYDALADGDGVIYTMGGTSPVVIGGLTTLGIYFVIKGTSPKIQLATSFLNAVAKTAIDLTSGAAGASHTLTQMDDDTQTKYSTSYVYTLVSAFGEEGPPSAPSPVFNKVDGQVIRVTMPATTSSKTSFAPTTHPISGSVFTFDATSGSIVNLTDNTIALTAAQFNALATGNSIIYTNGGGTSIGGLTTTNTYFIIKGTSPKVKLATSSVNATTGTAIDLTSGAAGTSHTLTTVPTSARKYLYRSNTGSNTTAFQLIADVPIGQAYHDDVTDNAGLAEVIPSTYWIGPPDEVTADYPEGQMKGLTALPGGIMAGFTGKRICFSEPYLPHAWPVNYRITLEEEIVAIGMAGNGLIVTTKGTPYLVAGADPRSMGVVRIEAAQACLNKRSLVDMGPYVMWAGADGLIMAAGTEVSVATEGLITPKQWLANYYPTAIKGYLWQGRYVGLYSSDPNYGGFIFDPRAGKNAFIELTQVEATAVVGGFTDPDDNELYLLANQASGNDLIKKFQGSATNKTFTWKSKEFVVRKPTSMGFLKVAAEAFPVTLKVYGDGTLFYTATITLSGTQHSVSGSYVNAAGSTVSISSTNIPEPVLRLPARVCSTFSIEISSTTIVNEVCIATEIDEIRGL